ncbi:MAG: hypothetical protein IPJ40_19650 [Saprospirales bacterium]|nr:hypothetical protein [Saprospirales bacterium]
MLVFFCPTFLFTGWSINAQINNPDSKFADRGLNNNITIDINALFINGIIETDFPCRLAPEWRGVGETFTPNGTTVKPLKTFEILEGTVTEAFTAVHDFPLLHYTHDFRFGVRPDSAYERLLGIQNGERQSAIEVEWETGRGQSNGGNPAQGNAGESFGFFQKGIYLSNHFLLAYN